MQTSLPSKNRRMAKYLKIFMIFVVGMCPAMLADSLFEVWPDAKVQGRYDEIGLRFSVGNDLVLIPGSAWCLVGGELLECKDAPRRAGDDIWIPSELAFKLRRAHEPAPVVKQPPKLILPVVVIDPGHGGKDPGATGLSGLWEKDLNLDMSQRVRNLLEGKGVIVKLTRTSDNFIELMERCRMSNEWKASLFISVHFNGNPDRQRNGLELYVYNGSVSAAERSVITMGGRRLKDQFSLPQYAPTLSKAPSDHESLFRWKDRESARAEQGLNRYLQHRMPAGKKSRMDANFAVLRGTMAPAVLIECEYISHPGMETLMAAAGWREKMARDIANGILAYFGLEPVG